MRGNSILKNDDIYKTTTTKKLEIGIDPDMPDIRDAGIHFRRFLPGSFCNGEKKIDKKKKVAQKECNRYTLE